MRRQLSAHFRYHACCQALLGIDRQRPHAGLLFKMVDPFFGDCRIGEIALVENLDARLSLPQFLQQRIGAGDRQPGIEHFDDDIQSLDDFLDQPPRFRHMSGVPFDSHAISSSFKDKRCVCFITSALG